MTYEPNEVEKQEYLAYHSERDFFNNLDRGLNEIEKYSFFRKRKKVALISGAMVAFDKGTINFLNKIIENDNKTQYLVWKELPDIDIVFFYPVCYNGGYGAVGAKKGARGHDQRHQERRRKGGFQPE